MYYAGDSSAGSIVNLLSTGWLLCDGSKYRRTSSTYSALYSIIGDAYGGDDNDFCVPMLKGLFLRGVTGTNPRDPDATSRKAPRADLPRNGNAGNAVGSLQTDAFQKHSHSYDEYSAHRDQDHIAAHETINNQAATTANMEMAGGSETRPRNIYANFIIKYLPNDGRIPIAGVIPYAGSIPNPMLEGTGWLPCDGAGLDASQYFDLHDIIETSYGGSGSTFYLPDYRGRFVRGVQGTSTPGIPIYDPDANTRTAPTSHATPGNSGNQVGSIQSDAIARHLHTYGFNDAYQKTAATAIGFEGVARDNGTDNHASGSHGGSETRPVNINVNYLIKALTVS
ncbi:MAG: tail fiber protein [Bacteroidetes bacterium]|nr:tail fiber protein [Bacteroidota bacterium]